MTETFRLNKHGVCINPNVIEYTKGVCSFKIKTAFADGCWIYGHAFCTSSEYWGSPCCACLNHKGFNTEKEAIRHAAKVALRWFAKPRYTCTASCSRTPVTVPKELFAELNKLLRPQPVQLSLFDNM